MSSFPRSARVLSCAAAMALIAGGSAVVLPSSAVAETAPTAADRAQPSIAGTGPTDSAASDPRGRLLLRDDDSSAEEPQDAAELPGGGHTLFPDRRLVAAYGTPGVPVLGILGEQDLDVTVDRVREIAAEYEDVTDELVIPAMEIITTMAAAEAGADGNYSIELDPETLRPWVDRAGEEDIYVVLDLQPGTTSFPEQAALYEDLLREPHVGLALDPEWRLEEGQRHREQIGSVDAAEINETAQWLADLTAEEDLPQKLFVLHQFTSSMITNREDIDTSHDELAMVLHADGHGTPEEKLGTWNALQRDLPEGIRMAWKNFYDEDTPTFTPEQTMDVKPAPWFVSYQ